MSQASQLKTTLIQQMSKLDLWDDIYLSEIPSKWEKHGKCVLFPSKAFLSLDVWKKDPAVLETVAQIFNVNTLARKVGPIQNDGFRRPKVELIFGEDPVVSKKENGIEYKWDITKCMFSSGNISEKQRIASWNLEGLAVIDLFAGIGYFTLTYLVHSKADVVYACEWNPEAVKYLECNLKLNKVQNRCIILPGDNQETCPKGVADHVNLGLIPSSEASWHVACAALKRTTGGLLHIHGNIDTYQSKNDVTKVFFNKSVPKNQPLSWHTWSCYVLERITECIKSLYPNDLWNVSVNEIFKIKSYGPHIDHIVVDIKCTPVSD